MRSTLLLLRGLPLPLCAGVTQAADQIIINSITTSARTEHIQRTNAPGAGLTLVGQDIDSGVGVDSYASLELRHTAYQSYSGFNAVRVGVLSANGLPENRFTSETRYDVNLTTGLDNGGGGYRLFLDYAVFPGAVGLSTVAPQGASAGYSFRIDATSYTGSEPDVGESGAVRIEKLANGTTAETIDQIFLDAGTQRGSVDFDGFLIGTRETQPFFDTAYLGQYGWDETVESAYVMSAFVSIPGYEIGGWASIGDPFALQADAGAEIEKHFPAGAPPFRIRMEAVAPIPEPGTWATMSLGFALLGVCVCHRERHRRNGGLLRG